MTPALPCPKCGFGKEKSEFEKVCEFLDKSAAAPYNQITDKFFLGDLRALRSHKDFDVILSFLDDEFELLQPETSKRFSCIDSPLQDMHNVFEETLQFVQQAESSAKILFHCVEGKSRSASVLIYVLMKLKGYTVDEALALLQSKRPKVEISNFRNQLE